MSETKGCFFMIRKRWVLLLVSGLVLTSLAFVSWEAAAPSPQQVDPTLDYTPVESGDHTRTLLWDGRQRSYIAHIPPGYDGSEPLPLVFDFHGGGGNANYARDMTLFSDKADEEGFIVVYPNGTGRLPNRLLTWNGGTCCAYAAENDIDDVGFVRAVVDDLGVWVNIDPQRIYATGLSNGAIMSYRLACEAADLFAAVAPVAGTLNYAPCQPSEPVAVLHIHGLADENVPYYGGVGVGLSGVDFEPVPSTVAFWVGANDCSRDPVITEGEHVIHDVYSECDGGVAVELYTLIEGGHSWPGGEPSGREGADEPSPYLDATDVIWDFFLANPQPDVSSDG